MNDSTDIEHRIRELEAAAQQAAEERIEGAFNLLHNEDADNLDFLESEERQRIEDSLAGPFCGCLTCEVRETLHAAYPFLRQIALLEAQHEHVDAQPMVSPALIEEIYRNGIPVIRDAGRDVQ